MSWIDNCGYIRTDGRKQKLLHRKLMEKHLGSGKLVAVFAKKDKTPIYDKKVRITIEEL